MTSDRPASSLPPDYAERVYAGVLGKIIGVYLGRPFEQWSHDAIMERLGEVRYYVHDRLGVPLVVTDDDISGTFTFLRALQDHGFDPHLTPKQIGESWLNYIIEKRAILWWGGMGMSTEHTAFLRLKHGTLAPDSGSIATNGKTVAEQIGAQIFIDGWGMICPGDPGRAADFARRAGSVSHDGEAIHGAQVVAAMVALAFVENDIDRLIDGGLRFIPADSVLAKMISDVRRWHAEGLDWQSGLRRIQDQYGYEKFGGGCHMIPNHAVIIHSLLHGAGDFDRSMMIVNTCGYDTDCNSGNVGCILGVRNGLAGFEGEHDWRGPVADRLYLPTADGGRAVSDAAREAIEVVNAGRALASEKPLAPKQGARFHFTFPGSVQGFVPDEATNAEVANVEVEPGRRALAIRFERLEPGEYGAVGTATFVPPDMRGGAGYRLLASPTLYPSQIVRACILASSDNAAPISASLYARVYDEQESLGYLTGPETLLKPGESAVLEWTVPGTEGFPIASVGIAATAAVAIEALLYLDYLTWGGSPSTTLKASTKGTAWRDAWVDGMDHFESWGEPFRLIQDEGTGLLIQGCREWTDYEVRSRIDFHMVERAGIATRVQGMRRWVALLLYRDGHARLIKSLEGETVLAEAEFVWEFGETHELSLRVTGDEFVGFVNGTEILRATDKDLTGGGVAFVVTEGRIGAHEVRIA